MISVLISTFNDKAELLDKAIQSILNQTYKDFEVVIVDDASSLKETVQLLKKYKTNFPNIFNIIFNEKNIGFAASLNKGISNCKGEYIARMDADDISLPNRLEIELEFLKQHKEFSFVSSPCLCFNKEGIFGLIKHKEEPNSNDSFIASQFVHPSILINKEVLVFAGGYKVYNLKTRTNEDYYLWCYLYSLGYKGYNLNDPLLLYREENIGKRKKLTSFNLKQRKETCKLLNVKKSLYFKSLLTIILHFFIPSKFWYKLHKNKLAKSLSLSNINTNEYNKFLF